MRFKARVGKLVEKLTGRECGNCKHNRGFVCASPKRDLCVNSIFPKGFEPREKGGAER